jgi:hypothetical protein
MSPDPSDIEDLVVDVTDLALRPGTYFNPQTEVIVVVDDSTAIDQEIFNMEQYEGADWVRISDEVPIDEEARDEVIEDLQKPRPGHAAAESDEDEKDVDAEEDGGQDAGEEE